MKKKPDQPKSRQSKQVIKSKLKRQPKPLSLEDRLWLEIYFGAAQFDHRKATQIMWPDMKHDKVAARSAQIMDRVGPHIDQWVEECNLTDEAMKRMLVAQLKAEKPVIVPKGSEVLSVPDWQARGAAVDKIYKHVKKDDAESEELNRLIAAGLTRLAQLAIGRPALPAPADQRSDTGHGDD